MSRFVFVTGGARSGKSDFAMRLAEEASRDRVYVATARALDPEMEDRVRRHREARGDGWRTVEEPLDIVGAVSVAGGGAVVVDCLTLWLTNMLMEDGDGFEDVAASKAAELAASIKRIPGTTVVVSNEVGLGIVPSDALTRKFRDAAGRVNRVVAEAADEVFIVVSGIPLKIK